MSHPRVPPAFHAEILNFSYILIDLQKTSFESQHLSLTTHAILYIFQKIWTFGNPKKFREYIPLIKDLILAEDAITLLQKIFVYIYAVLDTKPETDKKIIEAIVSKEKGDLAMTTHNFWYSRECSKGCNRANSARL